jgi:sugar O-acyltransferase (sialic acid O-acetyltransferase NeuD family)
MMDVVFVGGGGHASVLLDLARADPALRVVGYVAPEEGVLSAAGVERLGDDDCAEDLIRRGITRAVLGVAGMRDNVHRQAVFERWRALGFTFVSLRHLSAVVSPRCRCGEGLQVMPGAVINAGTSLGTNVIVNTRAVIEHDCVLQDHVHMAPGAVACGGVAIGAGSLVGAGSVIVPSVVVGAGAIIAAGSVVVRDVAAKEVVGGVPARPFVRRSDPALNVST